MTGPYTLKKMVGSYSPQQLIRTAIDVATSTITGAQADNRLIEGFATPANAPIVHDQTVGVDGTPQDEIWLDCVSDLGDGWNPTLYGLFSL